jgi:predicted nucleic acid-binding protein
LPAGLGLKNGSWPWTRIWRTNGGVSYPKPNDGPAMDSLLAATALRHGLCLVTRNEQNFAFSGLVVVNPFLERY